MPQPSPSVLRILGGLYHKTIGRSAGTEAAGLGLLGGGALALASPALASKMLPLMMAGASPEEKEQALAEMKTNGTLKRFSTIAGLTGGSLGALYGWQKHQPVTAAQGTMAGMMGAGQLPPGNFDSGRPRGALYSPILAKHASVFVDSTFPFNMPLINSNRAMNTISGDNFLTPTEKDWVTGIFRDTAQDRTGKGFMGLHVSGSDLASSAIRMGATAGAAYLFGKGVGGLFALPQQVTDRLSRAGAIAGAVVGSGILKPVLQ